MQSARQYFAPTNPIGTLRLADKSEPQRIGSSSRAVDRPGAANCRLPAAGSAESPKPSWPVFRAAE